MVLIYDATCCEVFEDEEVPADMVLLSARITAEDKRSGTANEAMVDTAALDGETTLKTFKSHVETSRQGRARLRARELWGTL